ncbi:hypothetical protein [Candidatus Electronema sp. PJ]|uniref:hypothetical protein n=1 Tax=Candidatus Electronema sp. PJ TaxID=3401572 RepID=UPI003AA8ED7E
MKNFEFRISFVNGDASFLNEGWSTGKDFLEHVYGDDTGVPVTGISISVETESGKKVSIVVPNNQSDPYVLVDGRKFK